MTRLIELADRYDAIFLDAYGVLVDDRGALPGAPDAVRSLRERGVPLYVITNDASRLPETVAERLAGFGLDFPAEHIVTSGQLLRPYFDQHQLKGARCIVLGPGDSRRYVERAGGRVIEVAPDADCDAVIVCDEDGFDFLPAVNKTLSSIYRRCERDHPPALIQPNPDLIYPKGGGNYGFTSGAIALLLEAGLSRRFPELDLHFARLGKPHQPMFDEAVRLAGSTNLLIVGDQIETDIAGARRAGLDAALLPTGVSRAGAASHDPDESPTYVLEGF